MQSTPTISESASAIVVHVGGANTFDEAIARSACVHHDGVAKRDLSWAWGAGPMAGRSGGVDAGCNPRPR
jgi:hypothetical protein